MRRRLFTWRDTPPEWLIEALYERLRLWCARVAVVGLALLLVSGWRGCHSEPEVKACPVYECLKRGLYR